MIRSVFVLLIAFGATMFAQTADTMLVKMKSGANVQYALASVNVLTFSGVQGKDTLNVHLRTGVTVQYSISLLDMISFTNVQPADSIIIEMKGGAVRAYAVSSVSLLSFIGWDKAASAEMAAPLTVSRYTLGQNYPNPFNPTTTINYYLPRQGGVTLTVSTVLGQVIARLVHEQQGEGMHRVTWDASKIPSGIYYYRLEAGAFAETKTMIVLK